jgi:SAM-dependent methyltransferase
MLRTTGYCVNFRPAVAKTLYEAHAPDNAKVYDFANGYGARCLGAIFANNVSEYVSVDVNTETINNTKKMILEIQNTDSLKEFMENKEIVPYLCGSEEFLQKYPEYKGYFDLSFSSPQYFDTEIYSQEETQSCHKYPKYAGWLINFYKPTIHNAIDVLKPDGVFIINIFEKLPKIDGCKEGFDLKKMTKVFAAEKGFYLYKCDRYMLRHMPGAGKAIMENGEVIGYEKKDRSKENFEAVWMFRHYESLMKLNYITKEQYEIYKQRHKK